jgi:hypothetical protein
MQPQLEAGQLGGLGESRSDGYTRMSHDIGEDVEMSEPEGLKFRRSSTYWLVISTIVLLLCGIVAAFCLLLFVTTLTMIWEDHPNERFGMGVISGMAGLFTLGFGLCSLGCVIRMI